MSVKAIVFGINAQQVRVVPSVLQTGLSSSSPGTLQAAGNNTVGADGITYRDDNTVGRGLLAGLNGTGATAFDAGGFYSRGTIGKVSDTFLAVGRWCDIAVMANQTGEIRLFFASQIAVSVDTSTSHGTFPTGQNNFNQVQDYPPMFVPNDLTKWTVWRRIEISMAFFIPVLFNVSAGVMTTYRFQVQIYDGGR